MYVSEENQLILWFKSNGDTSIGLFHLHLVYPFVYQFYTGMTALVETVQDFLVKLGIKPLMDLLKISIFSLNNDIVRLTKIMNNLV